MRLDFRVAYVAGVCLALLGCGGGDAQTENRIGFDADAAFANALAGATLSDLRATDPAGVQYTASLGYVPLSDGSFSGSPTRRSLQTTTIGRVGESPLQSSVTVYYQTGPARLLGTVTASGRTTVFAQVTQLPTWAEVGSSGVLAKGTVYADQTLRATVGTETLMWSIEPDQAETAMACLSSISRSGDWVSSEKDCFRIDGAGNIDGGTISVDRPGLALYFFH